MQFNESNAHIPHDGSRAVAVVAAVRELASDALIDTIACVKSSDW